MSKLGFSNPWRLTWQSKVGPKAWQGPQTAAAIEGLAKNGQKEICLVPIAFTSDHIETLFELDIEVAEDAEKVCLLLLIGSQAPPTDVQLGVHLSRAESLNGSPIFIRALADTVSAHMKDYDAGKIGPTSPQLMLRCPGCISPKCAQTKGWLSRGGREALPT